MELKGEVLGLRGLEEALRRFPEKLAGRALDSAVRAGLNVIKADARGRVQDDALLTNAMRVRKANRRLRRQGQVHYRLGFLRHTGAGARAAWREFGTKPHPIRAKRGKALFDRGTGKGFGRVVQHPGQRARPFLVPALRAAGPRAVSEMRRRLAKSVARIAKQLESKV